MTHEAEGQLIQTQSVIGAYEAKTRESGESSTHGMIKRMVNWKFSEEEKLQGGSKLMN